jgi:hypothetical protein
LNPRTAGALKAATLDTPSGRKSVSPETSNADASSPDVSSSNPNMDSGESMTIPTTSQVQDIDLFQELFSDTFSEDDDDDDEQHIGNPC